MPIAIITGLGASTAHTSERLIRTYNGSFFPVDANIRDLDAAECGAPAALRRLGGE